MLKKLIVGDVGLKNLSGPISIAKGAGTTADYGLVYFLGFLASDQCELRDYKFSTAAYVRWRSFDVFRYRGNH